MSSTQNNYQNTHLPAQTFLNSADGFLYGGSGYRYGSSAKKQFDEYNRQLAPFEIRKTQQVYDTRQDINVSNHSSAVNMQHHRHNNPIQCSQYNPQYFNYGTDKVYSNTTYDQMPEIEFKVAKTPRTQSSNRAAIDVPIKRCISKEKESQIRSQQQATTIENLNKNLNKPATQHSAILASNVKGVNNTPTIVHNNYSLNNANQLSQQECMKNYNKPATQYFAIPASIVREVNKNATIAPNDNGHNNANQLPQQECMKKNYNQRATQDSAFPESIVRGLHHTTTIAHYNYGQNNSNQLSQQEYMIKSYNQPATQYCAIPASIVGVVNNFPTIAHNDYVHNNANHRSQPQCSQHSHEIRTDRQSNIQHKDFQQAGNDTKNKLFAKDAKFSQKEARTYNKVLGHERLPEYNEGLEQEYEGYDRKDLSIPNASAVDLGTPRWLQEEIEKRESQKSSIGSIKNVFTRLFQKACDDIPRLINQLGSHQTGEGPSREPGMQVWKTFRTPIPTCSSAAQQVGLNNAEKHQIYQHAHFQRLPLCNSQKVFIRKRDVAKRNEVARNKYATEPKEIFQKEIESKMILMSQKVPQNECSIQKKEDRALSDWTSGKLIYRQEALADSTSSQMDNLQNFDQLSQQSNLSAMPQSDMSRKVPSYSMVSQNTTHANKSQMSRSSFDTQVQQQHHITAQETLRTESLGKDMLASEIAYTSGLAWMQQQERKDITNQRRSIDQPTISTLNKRRPAQRQTSPSERALNQTTQLRGQQEKLRLAQKIPSRSPTEIMSSVQRGRLNTGCQADRLVTSRKLSNSVSKQLTVDSVNTKSCGSLSEQRKSYEMELGRMTISQRVIHQKLSKFFTDLQNSPESCKQLLEMSNAASLPAMERTAKQEHLFMQATRLLGSPGTWYTENTNKKPLIKESTPLNDISISSRVISGKNQSRNMSLEQNITTTCSTKETTSLEVMPPQQREIIDDNQKVLQKHISKEQQEKELIDITKMKGYPFLRIPETKPEIVSEMKPTEPRIVSCRNDKELFENKPCEIVDRWRMLPVLSSELEDYKIANTFPPRLPEYINFDKKSPRTRFRVYHNEAEWNLRDITTTTEMKKRVARECSAAMQAKEAAAMASSAELSKSSSDKAEQKEAHLLSKLKNSIVTALKSIGNTNDKEKGHHRRGQLVFRLPTPKIFENLRDLQESLSHSNSTYTNSTHTTEASVVTEPEITPCPLLMVHEETPNVVGPKHFANFPNNIKPNGLKASRALFLWDYDDTILPSTYLSQNYNAGTPEAINVSKDEGWKMELLERRTIQSMELTLRAGCVVIITSAHFQWLAESCAKYLPKLWEFINKHRIRIVSARDYCENTHMHPDEWKKLIMKEIIYEFYGGIAVSSNETKKELEKLKDFNFVTNVLNVYGIRGKDHLDVNKIPEKNELIIPDHVIKFFNSDWQTSSLLSAFTTMVGLKATLSEKTLVMAGLLEDEPEYVSNALFYHFENYKEQENPRYRSIAKDCGSLTHRVENMSVLYPKDYRVPRPQMTDKKLIGLFPRIPECLGLRNMTCRVISIGDGPSEREGLFSAMDFWDLNHRLVVDDLLKIRELFVDQFIEFMEIVQDEAVRRSAIPSAEKRRPMIDAKIPYANWHFKSIKLDANPSIIDLVVAHETLIQDMGFVVVEPQCLDTYINNKGVEEMRLAVLNDFITDQPEPEPYENRSCAQDCVEAKIGLGDSNAGLCPKLM